MFSSKSVTAACLAVAFLCVSLSAQTSAPHIGKTITLKSKASDRFVTAWGQAPSVDIRAGALRADDRAEFDVIDAGNGRVALRSHANSRYWAVSGVAADGKVVSSSSELNDRTSFAWIDNADGTISLKSYSNGRYVSAVEIDTTIVPTVDPAIVAACSKRGASSAYRTDESSRFIITPDMLKPFTVKGWFLRASAVEMGLTEKFIVATLGLDKGLNKLTGSRLSKVITYLCGISGRKTISGIHNREPNAAPAQWTNWVYSTTGLYPALWSGDFLFQSANIANRGTMITEAKNQWNRGAVINLMYHQCPPTQNEACNWNGGVLSSLTDAQWTQLITDGTALNSTFKQRMRNIAGYLQTLKDSSVEVLFRPFHEMNQSVFWWGGRTGANGTAKLYRLCHDYLVDTLGLTNLFWIWDVQDLSYNFADYDPGDAYWDIMALDVYNSDYYTTFKYNTILDFAGNKLMAIGECAHLPTAAELTSQPRWVFFMGWSELVRDNNTTQELNDLFKAANVLTLDEMPGWKNVAATLCSCGVVGVRPGKLAAAAVADILLRSSNRQIRFELPAAGAVTVSLYNVKGQFVETLLSGDYSAGIHVHPVTKRKRPSGVYFVKLVSGKKQAVQKIHLLN